MRTTKSPAVFISYHLDDNLEARARQLCLFHLKRAFYGDSAKNRTLDRHARMTSNVDILAWPAMVIKLHILGEPPTRVDDIAFACDDYHLTQVLYPLDLPRLATRRYAGSPRASENDKYFSFDEDFERYVADCESGIAIDPFAAIDGLTVMYPDESSTFAAEWMKHIEDKFLSRARLIIILYHLEDDYTLSSFLDENVSALALPNNTKKQHVAKSRRLAPQLTFKSYSFPSELPQYAANMCMYKELGVGGEDDPTSRVELSRADNILIKSNRSVNLDISGKDNLRDDGPSFCQRKASELFFGKALYRQPGWCIDVRHSG